MPIDSNPHPDAAHTNPKYDPDEDGDVENVDLENYNGPADFESVNTKHLNIEEWGVVDMLDAGADPTGGDPIDSLVNDAMASETLLVFTPGTYKIESDLTFEGLHDIGVTCIGDVTFTVDADFTDYSVWNFGTNDVPCENVYVSGYTLDISADGAGARAVSAQVTGFGVVEDIDVSGRDQKDTGPFFGYTHAEDAALVFRRCRAPDGAEYTNAGDMSIGYLIGGVGTTRIIDGEANGFPNNGIYASNADGPVIVEGGLYKNNNVANVRLGGVTSRAENVRSVLDADPFEGDPNYDGSFTGRCFRARNDTSVFDNCRAERHLNEGLALEVRAEAHRATIRDTVIENTAEGRVVQLSGDPSTEDTEKVLFDNVTLHDTGGDTETGYAIGDFRGQVYYRDCEFVSETRRPARLAPGAVVRGGYWEGFDAGVLVYESADCRIEGVDAKATEAGADDIVLRTPSPDAILRDVRLLGSGTIAGRDNDRALVDGTGLNDGDPSSGGAWNGNGREGVEVYDTTNDNWYEFVAGSWTAK